MTPPRLVHWLDQWGILCGVPLFPNSNSLLYPCPEVADQVTCTDCRTIAFLAAEAENDTEVAEILLRERKRYRARQ